MIDWLAETARSRGRRLMVRLVKGAYWDTEVKRAQERGLAGYPVFTRKPMTDLCFTVCARKLLAARPALYPQFATHNALTVASVIEDAGGVTRLRIPAAARHGRGALRPAAGRAARCRRAGLCAGRRSSRPAGLSGAPAARKRRELVVRLGGGRPLGADRRRSSNGRKRGSGMRSTPAIRRFRCRAISTRRRGGIRRASSSATAQHLPRCSTRSAARCCRRGRHRSSTGSNFPASRGCVRSPIDGEAIGEVREGDDTIAAAAMTAAAAGFPAWSAAPIETRAAALERASDLLEARRGRLIALSAVRGRQDARRCGGRGARGGRFLPLLRGRGAPDAQARADAGTDRRSRTSFATAAAAFSSASARGTFRSRSSSVR